MSKESYGFSLRTFLKTEGFIQKHLNDKFEKIEQKNILRVGPDLLWMKELEDDSKLVIPSPNGDTGIPTWTRYLNDFLSGLIVIAGQPNSGKTTCLIQFIIDLLKYNEDVIVVDFSFDDPAYKRRTQLICNYAGLNYQTVGSPQFLNDEQKKKYVQAKSFLKEKINEKRYFLFEASEEFSYKDRKVGGDLSTYTQLEDAMDAFREIFPDKKIVFLVDAYNDINTEADDTFRLDKVIKSLKHKANATNIRVVLSAHVKKTLNRDLTLNDIKGTKELEFSSVFAAILRNEWKENALGNPLMVELEGKTYPVLSVEPFKNKSSSWSDPWFCGIDSYNCRLIPLTRDQYYSLYAQYVGKRK